MPGISGVSLIGRIRAFNATLPILVFSMHNELQVAKRVLQAGAWGLLPWVRRYPDECCATARRWRFIDPVIAEQMIFEKPVPGENAPHERLSERELHIMKLFAKKDGY